MHHHKALSLCGHLPRAKCSTTSNSPPLQCMHNLRLDHRPSMTALLRFAEEALGSKALLMSCPLQGSQDGKTWNMLRAHSNDQTLKLAGQYASWPIPKYAACIAFRFFRLYQGSSADLAEPAKLRSPQGRQMSLTYLELYGCFSVESAEGQHLPEQLSC